MAKKRRRKKTPSTSQIRKRAGTAPSTEEAINSFRKCLSLKKPVYALAVLRRFRKWYDNPTAIQTFQGITEEFANLKGDPDFSTYLKSDEFKNKYREAIELGAKDYEERQKNPRRACDSRDQLLRSFSQLFAVSRVEPWTGLLKNYLRKTQDYEIFNQLEEVLHCLYDITFAAELDLIEAAVKEVKNEVSPSQSHSLDAVKPTRLENGKEGL